MGATAESTFACWKNSKELIGTAYIIERNGTIYEVFDPTAWAWQFGLAWEHEQKIAFEKRFIGIEIASEGGLIEHETKLYCFKTISDKTCKNRAEIFDYGQDYRGYRYFDRYEQKQIDSLALLINELCTRFNIERKTPADSLAYYGEALLTFKGIIGHAMVRKDKSDPLPDTTLWQTLISNCALETVTVNAQITRKEKNLTDTEKDSLFISNVAEINKMDVSAGSQVKGLIMELAKGQRNTYIRLEGASAGGHSVNYFFLQGDAGLVFRIADALGFAKVTGSVLEVPNA